MKREVVRNYLSLLLNAVGAERDGSKIWACIIVIPIYPTRHHIHAILVLPNMGHFVNEGVLLRLEFLEAQRALIRIIINRDPASVNNPVRRHLASFWLPRCPLAVVHACFVVVNI